MSAVILGVYLYNMYMCVCVYERTVGMCVRIYNNRRRERRSALCANIHKCRMHHILILYIYIHHNSYS